MSAQATREYYAGLLIIQYRNKDKARKTILLVSNMSVCDGLPEQLLHAFDLDTAQGDQLTVLGRIVGVPRSIRGLDLEHEFFNFTDYVGLPASIGFGDYPDFPWTEVWQEYLVRAIYTLSDFELRALIRLKVIYNTQYSSLEGIKNALYNSFHGGIDVSESGKAPPGSDSEFFNFTDYVGLPDSRGFNDYGVLPYHGFFYDYSFSHLMLLTFLAQQQYRKVLQVADFIKVVPAPMAVGYEIVFV